MVGLRGRGFATGLKKCSLRLVAAAVHSRSRRQRLLFFKSVNSGPCGAALWRHDLAAGRPVALAIGAQPAEMMPPSGDRADIPGKPRLPLIYSVPP